MQVDSDELVGLDIPLRSIFKPSWPATSHAPTVVAHALDRFSYDRMKKQKSILKLLTIMLFLTSCKSYYNDTIDWMDKIELGTSLEDVKNSQPDFVEVDWNKPDSLDNGLRFRIEKIKGSNDILNMDHYLVFSDNKYTGRESTK